MKSLQRTLIEQARGKYADIYPCGSNHSLDECFTTIGNKMVFWFNTHDNSTRVLTRDIGPGGANTVFAPLIETLHTTAARS